MSNLGEWHTKAISLHYYTVPTGDWSKKGSATEFSDEEYYETISKTLYMDELIKRHSEIMSRRDPEGKIGLIVDEWGCWYDVEEGTNPGFLYQQNTMRDAIVAACNLNIFNNHSDKVVMANLAQAVNVLQSLILTEGEKMVKTPTYHVFDLFKTHQGGESPFLSFSHCTLLVRPYRSYQNHYSPLLHCQVSCTQCSDNFLLLYHSRYERHHL